MRLLGEIPVVRQGWTCAEQNILNFVSVALFVERALATEELLEWLSVSIMHNCLAVIDSLYNPLLLGVVNNPEDLSTSALNFHLVCDWNRPVALGMVLGR